MPDYETSVYILNPAGKYPNRSVVCDNIAYIIHDGIPLLVIPLTTTPHTWWEHGMTQEMLYGSFLLVRKRFPCFSFHPFPTASIHFRNGDKTNLIASIDKSRSVIDGKLDLPCLYDPYAVEKAQSDPAKYIAELRVQDAYIDLFHAPQIPFLTLIRRLRQTYAFMDLSIKPQFVRACYGKLLSASRHIHIAIHYFVNAARLVHEHFPEDAGLNLNLVLEAIVEDFSRLNSITDKKRAIESLKKTVQLPNEHMDFLEELYWARNEFLAHIDDQMFTDMQNIGDPDRYCYDHFESMSWLIRKYIRYREAAQQN